MFTVGTDARRVEEDLVARRLCCPDCTSPVAPWGHARSRRVRGRGESLRLRPRRVACATCACTHVLLPVSVLLRRADTVEVIGFALLRKTAGAGHRVIAAELDRPAGTVRGWLRRMTVLADRLRVVLLALAAECDAELALPDPAGSALGDLLAALGAACAAVTRRLGPCSPWQLLAAVSDGCARCGWTAGAPGVDQHEPPLPGDRVSGEPSRQGPWGPGKEGGDGLGGDPGAAGP